MITTTALMHPSYLMRIKAAVLRAVRDAHKPNRPRGIGQAEVFNRHNKPSLVIVARVGGGFEVFDDLDNDLTESVKTVLKAYHAALRANPGRIVLKNVRASFPRLLKPSTAPMWEGCTDSRRDRIDVLHEKLIGYYPTFADECDFEQWVQDVAQDSEHACHSAALEYTLLSEAE